MSATLIQLAEQVKDALNGHEFSEAFTAVRTYSGAVKVKEMKELTVRVAPSSKETELVSRSDTLKEVGIDIAVQQVVLNWESDPTRLDELMAIVDEIEGFLKLLNLSGGIWQKIENKPAYIPEHLDQHNLYTSVITSTYKVVG